MTKKGKLQVTEEDNRKQKQLTQFGMSIVLHKTSGMESIARLGPSVEEIVVVVELPLDDNVTSCSLKFMRMSLTMEW